MALTAKSLVLDLLSTMPPGHPVPVGALVRAAALLDVGENSLRVALARLRSRGLVESDERGLYRLGAAAHAVNRHVRSWRSVEERVVPWAGAWVAVAPDGGGARPARAASRRTQRAVRLLGFRPLTASLGVRPDNLAGGTDAVREHLEALALDAPGLVFRMDGLAPERQAAAERLWDARALERSYAETVEALAASAERLPSLPREAAMAESFRIGGEAVRRIVLDPLLPAPIVDVKRRRALVRAMRRYDRLGRRCWRGWTGEPVELAQSPGDGSGLADTRAA